MAGRPCGDFDDELCLHAKQLLRVTDDAVKTAFALGAVNGQYILLCESAYREHITMSSPHRESFNAANFHLSSELMSHMRANTVLDFEIGRVGNSGQYTIHGPALNLQYHGDPCLGKFNI